MRGLHLPNVQAHREKLKLNYRARGRPRLPKYLLKDLTDASVHDESSSEGIRINSPFVLKVITSGRNSGKKHTCFMNWQGPSTGIESDILVDAFRIAKSMHNLRYTRYVADGDSSTHSEIIARVPYGRNVEKIECANHACKCLKNRLYKKQHENAECRRFLSAAIIKKMRDFARNAIVCTTTEKKSAKDLISALKAIPLHFFRCDHRFSPTRCLFSGKVRQVNPEDTPSNIFLSHVYSAFDILTGRARLLIGSNTSNLPEYFMSIVARLIGGKNIMVSQSARYTTCVKAAGIRFTKGHSARLEIFRRTVGSTPSR